MSSIVISLITLQRYNYFFKYTNNKYLKKLILIFIIKKNKNIMLKQIRVAVIGMPDSGKSTFIKNILENVIGKTISIDTLMKEVHWSDGRDPYGNPDTRTIKCAKIFFKYGDYEYCFYDCPGHIEYDNQIIQGLNDAHFIIKIIDNKRLDNSHLYFSHSLFDDIQKPYLNIFSHSTKNEFPYYDVENDNFSSIAQYILNIIYEACHTHAIDIEEEAKTLIKKHINPLKNNAMFFSGGKDSLVGIDLLKKCDLLKYVKVYFPSSNYDFQEVIDIIKQYKELYCEITPFCNNGGKTYETNSSFEMLQEKANANNVLIKEKEIDLVCVQFRGSDEGVRSKDYHISDKDNHQRFSPVFYFSETNIWRYIRKYNLPYCTLYNKGYRSLGDYPITKPCMPICNNVTDIINYIDNNPNTNERDGRVSQDKSTSFAMEKLRDKGFF